jgi:hypothetical protein
MFGRLASFLETDRHYIPPAPVDPQANRIRFLGLPRRQREVANKDYEEKRKHWHKIQERNYEDYPRVFALIKGALSKESKDKVEQAANWADIDRDKDPLLLWRRIVETHQNGGDTTIRPFAKRRVLQSLVNIKQSTTESISDFKCRFDDAMRTFTSQWGVAPDGEAQACIFSGALDPHRYSVFELDMQNNVSQGLRQFPASLQEMYQLAGEFKALTNNGKIVDAAVYVSTGKQVYDRSDKKKDKTSYKDKGVKFKSKDAPPRPCFAEALTGTATAP